MRSPIAHARSHWRLLALVTVLCAVIPGVFVRASASNPTTQDSFAQPLSASQRVAVTAALGRMPVPVGFHPYRWWSVTRDAASPAVRCTSTIGVCFSTDTVLQPISPASVQTLLTGFGVRTGQVNCTNGLLAACVTEGSFSRYRLGIMVEVVHSVHPDERSGTTVTFFAGAQK
jgi:hypothetical protein